MSVESKLQEYLTGYKQEFTGKIWPDEKYKWEAVKCFQDNWDIDAEDFPAMLQVSLSKTGNLLQNSKYARSMIEELACEDTGSVRQMFRELFDENGNLYSRIEKFKNEAAKLCSQDKSHYQDENTISIYLWLKYPDKYYIYKQTLAKMDAEALQADYQFKKGNYAQNIKDFMLMYDEMNAVVSQDEELVKLLKENLTEETCWPDTKFKTLTIDVSYYIWGKAKEKSEMKKAFYKYLGEDDSLSGYSRSYKLVLFKYLFELMDEDGVADFAVITEKFKNYYLDRKNNGLLPDKDADPVIANIETSSNEDVYKLILKNPYNYIQDKGYITKAVVNDSEKLCLNEDLVAVLDENDLEKIKRIIDDKLKLYFQKVDIKEKENKPVVVEYKNSYSEVLLNSGNIIFHGAPGTGKTFLAKQIAADIISNGTIQEYEDLSAEQKEQIEFVQFHPSYDYTDFVEGLRPKLNNDGSMGFELQDGIFKRFCTRAKINIENSRKNIETAKNETIIDDGLNDFFSKLNYGKVEFTTTTGNAFSIDSVDDEHVHINVPNNPKTNTIVLNLNMLKSMLEPHNSFEQVKDVTTFFKKKYGSQEDSYYFAIYNVIKKDMKKEPKEEITIEERKDYIFIIDEINRGEISKIFGELFFSIDPGYRGHAGEVSTQYANLHSDAEEKFYVPENVYIIGTMNDIDRSVDTFDFAMRRRFRFIELKAKECQGMLDKLGDMKDEAIVRMNRLNDAIVKIDGLNDNYQIGPAYFLELNKIKSFDLLWSDYLQPLLCEYIHGMAEESDSMKTLEKAYNNTTSKEAENGENSQG